MPLISSISIPLAVGFDNPYLIQQSLEALVGPFGVVLMVCGFVLTFGAIGSKRVCWGIVSLILFSSIITSHVTIDFPYAYGYGLETVAQQGRNLVLLLMLILAIPSLMANRGTRNRVVHGGTIAYLAFQLLYTFEIAAARSQGSVLRVVTGVMLFLLTFLVFGFGISKMLQTGKDAIDAVRSLAWCGVLFTVLTTFLLLVERKSVIVNGRLVSVAATATFCAELLVAVMLPTFYLVIRSGVSNLARTFWVAILSLEGLMLIGTGTRTGLLMLFVGLVILLRARLAKLFPLAIGLTILISIVLLLLPEDLGLLGGSRMLDTTDTRTEAWSQGINAFKEAPFFGVSTEARTVMIENSYIVALAVSGLVGTLPFVTALLLFVRSLVQLQARRSRLDPANQLFVDLLIAGFVAELVGAMFDAYLVATVSIQLYVVVFYASLIMFVLDRTDQEQSQTQFVGTGPAPALAYDPAYAI